MWWDEERIRWYNAASQDTSFHRALTAILKEHLSRNEMILELGCGLGYVAEILSHDGYRIKATDNDENAIIEAQRRSHLDIFSVMDAGNPLPCCDTLLMLFFGRLAEEDSLGRYMENARRLIYVISEHRGQSNDLRKKAGEPERTIAYLNGQGGIRFSHIQFEEDFSQPLSSREEAIRYITRMYGVENAGKYLRYLTRTDTGYMLPNRKHASIFIIEKEEMK